MLLYPGIKLIIKANLIGEIDSYRFYSRIELELKSKMCDFGN